MRSPITGQWIGYGLGDVDAKVFDMKTYLSRKFQWVRDWTPTLVLDSTYDATLAAIVRDMQSRYGLIVTGIMDYATQVRCGYIKTAPKPKPVIFTVEGHLSNMWAGPCASTASLLEQQGLVKWQPVGYDCAALPFNNKSGVDELVRLVGATRLPDGTPFPAGTGWGIHGFSQGGMIVSEFMEQHVLPENGVLHWRLKDFKRGLGIGNPRRERGKLAPWAVQQLGADSGGIMDHLFVTTGTVIEDRWQENAHERDLFADNGTDQASKDKTIIAKVVTEGTFSSVAQAFLKVMGIFTSLPTEALPAIKAAFSAIFFLASNPNPHYATVAEPGDIEWMRGVAA